MENNTPTGNTPLATPPVDDGLIDIDYFAKVKLRVARIDAVEAVPKSSKLLKLQLDLGPELGKRQILSGIAKFYSAESLVGKKIVVIANLRPASLMGIESQGMLLAASDAEVTKLFVLDPGQDMEPGAVIR